MEARSLSATRSGHLPVFALLRLEDPDAYARISGLAGRVTGLAAALASPHRAARMRRHARQTAARFTWPEEIRTHFAALLA